MKILPPKHLRNRSRTGSIYVAILGLSLLVATIGIGGIAITRTQARSNDLRNDILEARSYAQSAIELGRTLIALDSTWRSDYTNGNWYTNQILGAGSFSLNVTNPNGALNHADTDPVILTATGTKGTAIQKIQVTLNMTIVPLTSLNTAISAGSLLCTNTTLTGAGSTVASNSTITAITANIYPNVSAVGAIAGSTFYNRVTAGGAAQTMPDSHVFDYYIANGTAIPISTIPTAGANYQIDQSLLSPASNPFSNTTNAQGIYVIDCQNNNIIIQNSRIIGTLVLLNTGVGSIIQKSSNWQPVTANFPCLLVKGSISIKIDTPTLKESSGHNFNPVGTPYPYPAGTTNLNTTDQYPSQMNGFAYVSGSVTADKSTIATLIVGGTLSTLGILNMTFSPSYYNSPAPGFYTVQMKPANGSWCQIVY